MVTSDSKIDFIQLARASGIDPDSIVNTPEFAEWLREYLSESEIKVTFTKKDGSERIMHCTRNFDMIPADKHPRVIEEVATATPKDPSDAVQAYDLEKQDWRAFKTSTIKHIEWNVA
jgi:hypothetical protein